MGRYELCAPACPCVCFRAEVRAVRSYVDTGGSCDTFLAGSAQIGQADNFSRADVSRALPRVGRRGEGTTPRRLSSTTSYVPEDCTSCVLMC